MTYYTLIAGWVVAYTWRCASGALTGLSSHEVTQAWQDFLADPLELGAWHLGFIALVGYISARGVNRGIEIATRVRAPVLLALLLVLVAYSLARGDVSRGLTFAFAPDFAAITPSVVLAAIGQAFFATGVGMAMMIAYGAYLERGTSLVRSSLIISSAILLVSLLSTVIVFPLVFRYGMNPAQGVDLVFDVLASVFAEMPGGRLVGTLFFLMLVFAALTPSLAGIEPIIAWLVDHHGWPRGRAVLATVVAVWIVGMASMLSFNLWRDIHPLQVVPGFHNRTVFDASDYLVSNIILPVGALLTTVFVGWRVSRRIIDAELVENGTLARRAIVVSLRYVCPIALAAVLVANLA
jgi:NSS family neurotransmitter:Na+ symporter